MKSATLRQFRIFVEVARQGGITRAAAALHLTPSAVSMHVRELEDHMGLALVERSGRGTVLSVAGKCLLNHLQKLLDQVARAESDMALLRGEAMPRENR